VPEISISSPDIKSVAIPAISLFRVGYCWGVIIIVLDIGRLLSVVLLSYYIIVPFSTCQAIYVLIFYKKIPLGNERNLAGCPHEWGWRVVEEGLHRYGALPSVPQS
jgi:hypothetical protein